MGLTRRRKYFLALLGLGAGAFVVDRAVLQPSAAEAAPAQSGRSARSAGVAQASEPRDEPIPAPSVPHLAARVGALETPAVTPDIFRADPAEWGLPAPGGPERAPERTPEVELRLSAIMNADGAGEDAPASRAVINSRIVHIGGTVAGFVVEKITPTGVRLRRGEQTRELRLAR